MVVGCATNTLFMEHLAPLSFVKEQRPMDELLSRQYNLRRRYHIYSITTVGIRAEKTISTLSHLASCKSRKDKHVIHLNLVLDQDKAINYEKGIAILAFIIRGSIKRTIKHDQGGIRKNVITFTLYETLWRQLLGNTRWLIRTASASFYEVLIESLFKQFS